MLALGLVERGLKVAMIDSDPNKPLLAWSELPDRPTGLTQRCQGRMALTRFLTVVDANHRHLTGNVDPTFFEDFQDSQSDPVVAAKDRGGTLRWRKSGAHKKASRLQIVF